MLKHFIFWNGNEHGRFAVRVDGDGFHLARIAGNPPPVWVLGRVLPLMDGAIEAANEAALARRNEYTIVRRIGMSGAINYCLIERRDDLLADYPTRAGMHISMYGKLNQGVRCWLGDLVPLLAEVIKCGDLDEPESVQVEEAPLRDRLLWQYPGSVLLTIHDDGGLDYDVIENPAALTGDDPVLLGAGTLAKITEWAQEYAEEAP